MSSRRILIQATYVATELDPNHFAPAESGFSGPRLNVAASQRIVVAP
jgi:hypothetical protein